ncbi:hypothetical protein [Litorimonas sp. WD9-15]|uniref:hypothetical protein n=1 Tax=Litorimonas sp. WD9-15 TaxID=3418716 RepID=UPI003D005146
MKPSSHILRLCLAVIIAVQFGWSGQMRTNAAGEYICNPGGQPPSAETIAQIRDLFAAAGKTLPEDVDATEHCADCVMPGLATLPAPVAPQNLTWADAENPNSPCPTALFYDAQGPPLGGRAPPTFT